MLRFLWAFLGGGMEDKNINATFYRKLQAITSIEGLLDFFEIGFDQHFIDEYGTRLYKRYNGNVILAKPNNWFEYRRALKNAYCKIQRARLPAGSRSACRGCTTCERR